MIRRKNQYDWKELHSYQVKSESGKNLSKPNLTKAQAHKRLAQVEYFKHKKWGSKGGIIYEWNEF